MAFMINEEKCVGCGACAWVCLFNVPRPTAADRSAYSIPKEKCVGCGQCETICPNNAVEPLPDHKKVKHVEIMPEACIGCTVCAHICPEKAPAGERGKPFVIEQAKCTQCGACAARCIHHAIRVDYYE